MKRCMFLTAVLATVLCLACEAESGNSYEPTDDTTPNPTTDVVDDIDEPVDPCAEVVCKAGKVCWPDSGECIAEELLADPCHNFEPISGQWDVNTGAGGTQFIKPVKDTPYCTVDLYGESAAIRYTFQDAQDLPLNFEDGGQRATIKNYQRSDDGYEHLVVDIDVKGDCEDCWENEGTIPLRRRAK